MSVERPSLVETLPAARCPGCGLTGPLCLCAEVTERAAGAVRAKRLALESELFTDGASPAPAEPLTLERLMESAAALGARPPTPRIWATPERYQELRAALIADGAPAKGAPSGARACLVGVEIRVSSDPRAERDLRPDDIVLE